MRRFSALVLATAMALSVTACGKKDKDKDDDEKDPPKTDDVITLDDDDVVVDDDSADTVQTLTLGQEASIQGDVVADEDGMFSLTGAYHLTLDTEKSLRVRKIMALGNCGASTASFFFSQDGAEEPIDFVTIDPAKDYGGVPAEPLSNPLPAGSYWVGYMITTPEECKDKMFFYDFILEEAP